VGGGGGLRRENQQAVGKERGWRERQSNRSKHRGTGGGKTNPGQSSTEREGEDEKRGGALRDGGSGLHRW
jgi:hypothetical protein